MSHSIRVFGLALALACLVYSFQAQASGGLIRSSTEVPKLVNIVAEAIHAQSGLLATGALHAEALTILQASRTPNATYFLKDVRGVLSQDDLVFLLKDFPLEDLLKIRQVFDPSFDLPSFKVRELRSPGKVIDVIPNPEELANQYHKAAQFQDVISLGNAATRKLQFALGMNGPETIQITSPVLLKEIEEINDLTIGALGEWIDIMDPNAGDNLAFKLPTSRGDQDLLAEARIVSGEAERVERRLSLLRERAGMPAKSSTLETGSHPASTLASSPKPPRKMPWHNWGPVKKRRVEQELTTMLTHGERAPVKISTRGRGVTEGRLIHADEKGITVKPFHQGRRVIPRSIIEEAEARFVPTTVDELSLVSFALKQDQGEAWGLYVTETPETVTLEIGGTPKEFAKDEIFLAQTRVISGPLHPGDSVIIWRSNGTFQRAEVEGWNQGAVVKFYDSTLGLGHRSYTLNQLHTLNVEYVRGFEARFLELAGEQGLASPHALGPSFIPFLDRNYYPDPEILESARAWAEHRIMSSEDTRRLVGITPEAHESYLRDILPDIIARFPDLPMY